MSHRSEIEYHQAADEYFYAYAEYHRAMVSYYRDLQMIPDPIRKVTDDLWVREANRKCRAAYAEFMAATKRYYGGDVKKVRSNRKQEE